MNFEFFLAGKTNITKTTKIWVLLFINTQIFKGQLISKRPFGVFKSPKTPTKFFPGFLPKPLKRGQIKKIGALYTASWRISF
jgi:hypothetical protein